MPIPIPIIASDMTITSRSVINHSGMRLAGSVIACASTTRVVCAGRGQVSMNQITIRIYLTAMAAARLDAEGRWV